MPYLTYEPELILQHSCQNQTNNHFPGSEPLKKTLYHSFDPESQEENGGHSHIGNQFCNDTEENHKYEDEEDFCCMLWMQIVFMGGFALSQFLVNIFENKFFVLKCCIRVLVVSGLLAAGANNVYLFAIAWFIVAFTSSATYLLVISHVLEALDEQAIISSSTNTTGTEESQQQQQTIHNWKWRLIGGLCFHFNWSISRLLAILIVFLNNEWNTVLLAITIYIAVAYFCLEYLIWNDDFTKNPKSKTNGNDEPEEEEEAKIFHVFWNNKAIYFNTVILSSIWFMVCLNFYGLFRSWCKISIGHLKFENDILSTGLGIVGETLGLAISLIAKQKILPLILLQICISVTYFCMMSIDPGEIQTNEIIGILSQGTYGVMFVAHINMCLATAAMGLLWMITVEAYPKKYRPFGVGLCSGIGRLGGIIGLILGEYKKLHLSNPAMIVIGVLTFISAVLVNLLPDLTKKIMPKKLKDIEHQILYSSNSNVVNNNVST